MGEEIEALENHTDFGALSSALPVRQSMQLDAAVRALDLPHADEFAVDPHPAGIDGLQLVDAAQQGRLTRAGGTHEHRDRARLDPQIDALENVQLAEELVQAAHENLGDDGGRHGPRVGGSGRLADRRVGSTGPVLGAAAGRFSRVRRTHGVTSRKGLSSAVREFRTAC